MAYPLFLSLLLPSLLAPVTCALLRESCYADQAAGHEVREGAAAAAVAAAGEGHMKGEEKREGNLINSRTREPPRSTDGADAFLIEIKRSFASCVSPVDAL